MSSTPIVIQKYGGTSLATVEKIHAAAARTVEARRGGPAVVAVVSAMDRTTDRLEELATSLVPDPPHRELDILLATGEQVSMALLSMAIQALGVPAVSLTGSECGIRGMRHAESLDDVPQFR